MQSVSQLSPCDAYDRLLKGALLVDVRELDETKELSCSVPNSITISMSQLQDQIQVIPTDKEIITVCYSGARSYVATQILNASGYSNVSNLTGGIIAWKKEGLPIK